MRHNTFTTKFNASSKLSKISATSTLEDQLLDIYWNKKDLESFLPGIAKYSSPTEICRITLSQLETVEKLVINILREMAEKETGT